MINDLKAIAIFVEVVRNGSFRRAAHQLNLSPSAVSYNVAQLEKRVGNALLYRSTRKLSLTTEGEHLYQRASTLLAGVRESLSDIAGTDSTIRGRLVISATSALIHSPADQTIARFCKSNPNVDIDIHYTDERQNLIEEGIDLVLRAGEMPDSSLKSRLIMYIERKLVCSKTYYLARSQPQCPSDLSDWQWVKLTMMPDKRTIRKAKSVVDLEVKFQQLSVNNVQAMVNLGILDMGLISPPSYMVKNLLEEGTMVEVLPEWVMDPIPVYAVWPGSTTRNRNVQALVEMIQSDSLNLPCESAVAD